jgi:hypothetical protein
MNKKIYRYDIPLTISVERIVALQRLYEGSCATIRVCLLTKTC